MYEALGQGAPADGNPGSMDRAAVTGTQRMPWGQGFAIEDQAVGASWRQDLGMFCQIFRGQDKAFRYM